MYVTYDNLYQFVIMLAAVIMLAVSIVTENQQKK